MKYLSILALFCLFLGCDSKPAQGTKKPVPKKHRQTASESPQNIAPQNTAPQNTVPQNTAPQVPLRAKSTRHTATMGPAAGFLKRFFRSLKYANKPSQQLLNNYLRQLDSEGKKHIASSLAGDIYNLTGRFYYYKIDLERRENRYRQHLFLKKDWVESWRQQAMACFEKARLSYLKPGAVTCMNLAIKDWMPEDKSRSYIRYENVAKAAKEMERWRDKNMMPIERND